MVDKVSFFSGKKAVVTGAGKGIGHAVVEALVKRDVTVIAISRGEEDLRSLKEEFRCITIQAELEDPEMCVKAAREATTYGPIDFLINCAGITILEPFLETKLENLQKVFKVNLEAMFLMSQVIAKNMVDNKIKGAIVNMSSQGSKVALINHTSYCVSKGAVDQLTKMMALELGLYGIKVNSVNPTVVMTDMGKKAWGDRQKALPMLSRIPMGRFAQVPDVVKAILFLLNADMVTGHQLPVDGGFLSSPFTLAKL